MSIRARSPEGKIIEYTEREIRQFYSVGSLDERWSVQTGIGDDWIPIRVALGLDSAPQNGKSLPQTATPNESCNPETLSAEKRGQGGDCQSEIAELLRIVVSNQQRQLDALKAIRWLIVGFSIWFIVQFWFLPKLLVPT